MEVVIEVGLHVVEHSPGTVAGAAAGMLIVVVVAVAAVVLAGSAAAAAIHGTLTSLAERREGRE